MAKGLGKGLSALIAEKPRNIEEKEQQSNIVKLPIEKLAPGKFQPRQVFKEDELHELADSIRKNGVFQPILIREIADSNYEIIAGERRWRASKICGLDEVPVIIMQLEDREALEIAIIENVQRQDLMVLEEAEGYSRLIEEFEYTQDELADVIGKSRSAIANSMRLLNLPKKIKKLVNDEVISAGHARALLGSKEPEKAAQMVVKKGLNVRQTESLVKRLANPSQVVKKVKDPEMTLLENEITNKVGHKISISNKGDHGKITIAYKSLEELDIILKKLKS